MRILILMIVWLASQVFAETPDAFLNDYNTNLPKKGYNVSVAAFIKATNITDYNTKVAEEESEKYSKIAKIYLKRARNITLNNASNDTKRQFKLLLMTKSSSNDSITSNIIKIGNEMENIYSKGCVPYDSEKVPSIKNPKRQCLKLDSDINPILSTSRNPEELLYLWKGWRKAVGTRELKDKYKEYVGLNNIGARENGYEDAGDYKRKVYEVTNLKESAEQFWKELEPFYQEVHAYVRYKLTKKYPIHVSKNGPIPAHLLGNMWAQSWEGIMDIVSPYKDEPELDITPMLKKIHNVTTMFQLAEQFFVSLGWRELPKQFWQKSMLKQPSDRNVTCHASAWDFSIKVNGEEDVRVKMCTNIDQNDFITIHHELGHIYYYLKYWNQPYEYRTGANPGFHEAVGDTLSLSVQTPNHLHKVGLLANLSYSDKADINFLMKTALEKIAFLPFGYLMDQWMWGVYSGEIKPEEYNKKWWEMRLKYQGIEPPVKRTEENFDPGAKYHIPADTPYIRYFFAHILQFMFHKHACNASKFNGPLHKCSIYNSTEAGKLLGDMLTAGKSKPWPETLEQMTGSRKLSADPIKEYFRPLTTWLKKQRNLNKYPIGWQSAEEFLTNYNLDLPKKEYISTVAAFIKATNITDYNTKVAEEEAEKYSKIAKEYIKRARNFNLNSASNDTKRQFKLILMTKSSSNDNITSNIIKIGNEMENIYSKGCVPYDPKKVPSIKTPKRQCLKLDSDINPILSTSRNPEELLYLWQGWRKAVGTRELKDKYKEYVGLNNIGARENGYEDAGDYKRKVYEVTNLKESAEQFWKELEPFYQEVHAYVRYKLTKKYPGHVSKDGPIPAHLLGNMWAQSWEGIMDIVSPYKDEPELDITTILKKKHNVTTMFQLAEQFFVSLGWRELPKQFWQKSMLKQPSDRNVTCHASAWDFSIMVDGEEDVRVKMCTNIDQSDFITIHHELGHIYYFLKYWNQSYEYRTGANPGFHEAVGDTISLSVQTPNHLHKVGLLANLSYSDKADINFLMKTALEKIAFLPFGYLMDQWMWGVYSGEIKPEEYNKKWWEMRLKYQGIEPPVKRTENNFDPGAKYHIPADTPYIRYFFAHILQFTFHKHACNASKYNGPLHKCSIYNSTEAGKLLGDMLAAGKSKPWPETLEQMTGSRSLSAEPIKEYFRPLAEWLKNQRATEKYPIGWTPKTSRCSKKSANRGLVFFILILIVMFR